MEWENQLQDVQENDHGVYADSIGASGGINVKVMTDEQLETLRKQIAIYTSICERLAETHRTLTAQQDFAGGNLGVFFSDPLMKTTGRQRWTPTLVQLQILEQIFDQGNGTPSKEKIKDIATKLSQHGQISEANVYNWFQNRRARSKRKKLADSSNNNNGESESSDQEKTKPKNLTHSCGDNTTPAIPRAEDLSFQIPGTSCDIDCFGMLSNPRDEHIDGDMGLPESYNPFDHENDYDMMS